MNVPETASRVAVLSDVHGNAVALEAVLSDVDREAPDLVVFGGDLTWGPMPHETLELVRTMALPTAFVRGNAERSSSSRRSIRRARRLDPEAALERGLALLATFTEGISLEIAGLGQTYVCHGSPRSDEELVTPRTPAGRMQALTAAIPERVLVTAHTHVQFDRRVAGIRSVNAGSVGMPYEPQRGAFWALLGPDVELKRTDYSLDRAVAGYRSTEDPDVERMVEILESPPTRDEAIDHAERLEFSG